MSSSRCRYSTLLVALSALVACSKDSGSNSLLDRGSCEVLIECASELAPETQDAFEASYGQFGTCWQGSPSQWQLCRDTCLMSLDALNLSAMASGEPACGVCATNADCVSFGVGAYCSAGYCAGGSGSGSNDDIGDETTGDGDPTTGDGDPTTTGDGDPTTGDGDGDPTTTGDGDGDGDPTTTGDGDGDPTTTGDGDGDPPASCGWNGDARPPGYYCGFMGEDPQGTVPIDCPPGLVVDEPCGVIDGAGCCDANGDNWYCAEDGQGSQFLFMEEC